MYVCIYMHIYIYVSISMIYVSIYVSIYLSICLSIYQSFHTCIHTYINLFRIGFGFARLYMAYQRERGGAALGQVRSNLTEAWQSTWGVARVPRVGIVSFIPNGPFIPVGPSMYCFLDILWTQRTFYSAKWPEVGPTYDPKVGTILIYFDS